MIYIFAAIPVLLAGLVFLVSAQKRRDYQRGLRDGYEQAAILYDSPFGQLAQRLTHDSSTWKYEIPREGGTLKFSANTLGELALLVHRSEVGEMANAGAITARGSAFVDGYGDRRYRSIHAGG